MTSPRATSRRGISKRSAKRLQSLRTPQSLRALQSLRARVQGPPKLDDASSWLNYKKRLAIWKKACNMSEMTMGAMIAMSLSDSCKFKANLATRFYDVVEQTKMGKIRLTIL